MHIEESAGHLPHEEGVSLRRHLRKGHLSILRILTEKITASSPGPLEVLKMLCNANT